MQDSDLLTPEAESSTGQNSEFAMLMERLQAGCQQSARLLMSRYGPHILLAVRRRLHPRLRTQFDSLDFMQDVWASFFTDVPTRRTFERPEALIAYLTKMARNKVSETARDRLERKKRNMNRELSMQKSLDQVNAVPANIPTPSEIVMGREEWNLLLDNLPPVYRLILSLVRQGKDIARIAKEANVSEKTVRRVIKSKLPGVQL